MKIFEVEQSVNWAVGPNISNATPSSRFYQTSPDYEVHWVNIRDVMDKTEKYFRLDLDDPTGGPNVIGKRIPRAIAHFSQGFMDPSTITYNAHYNSVAFTDGRHRLYAAYQLGERWAPVIIPKEAVSHLRKLISFKD